MGGDEPRSKKVEKNGSSWKIYKHVFPGRKIIMNNRKGVVTGVSKSMLVPFGVEEFPDYWVEFEEGSHELVSFKDVKSHALNEFDEGPYTKPEIIMLQKNNWELEPGNENEARNRQALVVYGENDEGEEEEEQNEEWDGAPVVKLNMDKHYMQGSDGYIYTKDQAYTEGDHLIEDWYFIDFDPETEWEVEKIVRHRRNSKGALEYLLKYKGYELNPGNLQYNGDWKSQSGVQDCLDLVNAYLNGLKASRNPLCIYSEKGVFL